MNPRMGQFFMTQRGQFRVAFDKAEWNIPPVPPPGTEIARK
jgi:hypothetical protein